MKHVKRKADLAVIQGYSLHRTFSSQYQALGVIASVTAPWCKENGELQLFALSCKENCSCEP